MAITMHCDRCGREVEESDVSGRLRLNAGAKQLMLLDMCPNCRSELLWTMTRFLDTTPGRAESLLEAAPAVAKRRG